MKIVSRRLFFVAVGLVLGVAPARSGRQAQAWGADDANLGSVSGQFLLEGDAPAHAPLVKKGDASVKDSEVCAAAEVPSETLVVDSATHGIANVFVYLEKAPSSLPAKLKTSAEKSVVFDQKGCRFVPHAIVVRTDQFVNVKSDDNCAHNTHTYPKVVPGVNFALLPNSRDGINVPQKTAEKQPIEVKCDIHPWMKAYWLVLDHPYAAVTDAQGKFTIKDLPPGEYQFRVWQESAGYLDRALKVTITAGKTTDVGTIKEPVEKFKP